jgi:hypothetical protein
MLDYAVFYGLIYNSFDNIIDNKTINYQIYHNNTWSDIYTTNNGQYEFNSEMLLNFNSDHYILIAFWIGDNKERLDYGLENWCYIVLDDIEDINTNNIQFKDNLLPNLDIEITIDNMQLIFTDNSNDNHEWTYDNMSHYQSVIYDNTSIFNMNILPNSYLTNWDDGVSNTNLIHTYSNYGSYIPVLRVYNRSNNYSSFAYNFNLSYPEPEIEFTSNSTELLPNQTAQINNISNLGLNQLVSWEWQIDDQYFADIEQINNVNFNSIDNHTLKLICNYNNACEITSKSYSININQLGYSIVSSNPTYSNTPQANITFNIISNVSGHVDVIEKIEYYIDDNLLTSNSLNLNATNHNYILTEKVYYNDGFDNQILETDYELILYPIAKFNYIQSGSVITFNSQSLPGKKPNMLLHWVVRLNGNKVAELIDSDTLVYRFPKIGVYTVNLRIIDSNDNEDNYNSVFTINNIGDNTSNYNNVNLPKQSYIQGPTGSYNYNDLEEKESLKELFKTITISASLLEEHNNKLDFVVEYQGEQ